LLQTGELIQGGGVFAQANWNLKHLLVERQRVEIIRSCAVAAAAAADSRITNVRKRPFGNEFPHQLFFAQERDFCLFSTLVPARR